MHFPTRLLLLIPALLTAQAGLSSAHAGERKPEFVIRVHQETSETDSAAFAIKANRTSGSRQEVSISKIPLLTERDIVAVYPFKAADGSNAVALQLRPHGRLALSVASAECLGRYFLIYANGRQLPDVYVDAKVEDGIFVVPGGLTDAEIQKLAKLHPMVGASGKKKK